MRGASLAASGVLGATGATGAAVIVGAGGGAGVLGTPAPGISPGGTGAAASFHGAAIPWGSAAWPKPQASTSAMPASRRVAMGCPEVNYCPATVKHVSCGKCMGGRRAGDRTQEARSNKRLEGGRRGRLDLQAAERRPGDVAPVARPLGGGGSFESSHVGREPMGQR